MKTDSYDPKLSEYAAAGMLALVPGFRYALDRMRELLEEFETQIAAMQAQPLMRSAARAPAPVSTGKQGWSNDPEERRREMMRRMAKRKRKAAKSEVKPAAKSAASHPRDPGHPKHAEWIANVSKAAKKRWEKMSVRDRKNKLALMAQGRKSTPVVSLGKTA